MTPEGKWRMMLMDVAGKEKTAAGDGSNNNNSFSCNKDNNGEEKIKKDLKLMVKRR